MPDPPKMTFMALAGLLLAAAATAAGAATAGKLPGEAGFRLHCTACHADGGNIIRPEKTLSSADREKNGITDAAAIVRLMRNPGPGMSQFDAETIPEREANDIADYILKTFR
jgi:cytochrome c6